MKSNKNEELKSRRDFFKKAAKSALPIIGAIALSNIPVFASNTEATGCNDGCTAACSRICAGCQTSCHSANCYHTCTGKCDTTCRGTCYRTCSGGCDNSSSRY